MYHLTWFKASSSRSVGSASTLYSPHHGFSSFSGLKRLILRLTFIAGIHPSSRRQQKIELRNSKVETRLSKLARATHSAGCSSQTSISAWAIRCVASFAVRVSNFDFPVSIFEFRISSFVSQYFRSFGSNFVIVPILYRCSFSRCVFFV